MSASECSVGIDDSFGPWAGPECRGGFDFTLFFEETILAIPLLCLFLLGFPDRLLQLSKVNTKVVPGPHVLLKQISAVCLLVLNAAQLATWATTSSYVQTRATLPTASLALVTSLGLCLLSWIEHVRSIRPSFVVSIYLFLSVLLDLARARTLSMLDPGSAATAIFIAGLALRAIMFVLESIEKRSILVPSYQGYSPEETSSTLSRSVFWWLMSLFMSGYKKILTMEDLYPLDTRMHSAPLYQHFADKWAQVPDKLAPNALFTTWMGAFAVPILGGVFPKLCQIGFTYAQPFLIDAALDLAYLPSTPENNNIGYGLVGAYIIVYTGIAISTGQYEWRMHRTASLMRGSVVAAIYEKSLRLDLASSGVSPEGALTMISTDIEIICPGVVTLHDIWGALIEISIGIYLLYRQLGAACAMPIAIVVVSMFVVSCIAIPTGNAQAAWVQASQDRVTATTRTLGSIKWLKISGLSELAFSKIRDLRTQELKTSIRYRRLQGCCMVMLICVPIWSPILTICTYAGIAVAQGNTLTVSQAFVSFALFTLVSKPLAEIIQSLPILATCVASFQRIQDFLNGKEWVDKRLMATPGSKLDAESASRDSNLEKEKLPDSSESKTNSDVDNPGEKGSHVVTLEDEVVASVRGTLSWNEESTPVIDIVDWRIRKHAFTLVLGPVGCGKSTLLRSLLGDFPSFKGTISTSFSRIGYCAQNAWLPNDSVRNVILGRSPYDAAWYETVLKACALEHDIRTWPDGENTATGRKGFSLSGGQKHRVSIARALYSRPELLIFDDVFSGLDASTEDLVFNGLLGSEGLIRAGNMTVVMSSSDARRGIAADYVVFLDVDGRLSEKKTVHEIKEKIEQAVVPHRPTAPKEGTSEMQRVASVAAPPTVASVAVEDLPEDATRQKGDSAIYKFYAHAVGWFSLTTFCVAMTIFAFTSTFPNIWIKWWSESNATDPNEDLGKWIGGYIGLGSGSAAAVLFGTYQLFITIVNHSGVYFHDLLLKTTSSAPMSFHAIVDSGVTVNRFSQDLQLIDMELPVNVLGLAVGVAFCVADFIMISVSSKYIAAFIPFVIATLYVVQNFYLRTSRQMRLLDIEHKAPLYTQLTQTIDGLSTIRAFKWEDSFEENNMRLLDDSQRPSYLLYCVQRWLTFVVDIIIMVIAVLLAVLTTTLREQIGPGFIGIALSNILAFSATVKTILTSWVMLEVSLGAVARVRKFGAETEPEHSPDESLVEPDGGNWPSQGVIELSEVTASYSAEPVLKNVSFSIQAREKVVICGRTGSGKSSLLLCLLRLVPLDSGSITIDGVSLSTLPHEYVRSKLVAVPQETYIFDDTVRHNLDPGHSSSDDEIVSALQKVKLWDKITQRGGLDTVIQDGFLSQGEAQLFVFARAMLRKSKVLLLDEFESSLDDDTSNLINEVLRSAFKDWTVITIAHKLHNIVDFDKAIVLDGGRVVECDQPRRLLERDSMFKKLYELSTTGRG